MNADDYADAIVNETLDSWERTGPHSEKKSAQYLWRLAVTLLERSYLHLPEIIGKCRNAGIQMGMRPSRIEKVIDDAIRQVRDLRRHHAG